MSDEICTRWLKTCVLPVCALDVAPRLWARCRLMCCLYQPVQDAAIFCQLGIPALKPHGLQRLFHGLQLPDAFGDMVNVLVQQSVYIATLGTGSIFEAKQGANLIQRHVKRAAVANERQSFDAGLVIGPVVGLRPSRLGQEAFALVKPDRLSLRLSSFSQFANFHVASPGASNAVRALRSIEQGS